MALALVVACGDIKLPGSTVEGVDVVAPELDTAGGDVGVPEDIVGPSADLGSTDGGGMDVESADTPVPENDGTTPVDDVPPSEPDVTETVDVAENPDTSDAAVPEADVVVPPECTQAADCPSSPCRAAQCVAGKCTDALDPTQDGLACSVVDLCASGGVCQGGACVATPKDCTAVAKAPCTVGVCNPDTGACEAVAAPDGKTCDDGDLCTQGDTCTDGVCGGEPLDCSAFETECAVATCIAGKCKPKPLPDGSFCVSTNVCVVNAQCLFGSCEGAWNVSDPTCKCSSNLDCDDGLACTVDICDVGTGACLNDVFGDACVIDGACWASGAVNAGANVCQRCTPGESKTLWSSVPCDDGAPCTDSLCDPALGCIHEADDGNSCDDGDPCTTDDHCQAGACVGSCECKVDADCSDTPLGACERAACVGFACLAVPDPTKNGTSCNDGDLCTTGDVCGGGVCVSGASVTCQPTATTCASAACDPATGTCATIEAASGADCDDGDPCTTDDACDGKGGCTGMLKDCDAGFTDACNQGLCELGTCVRVPKVGAFCDDAEPCTPVDICDDGGACTGAWDADIAGCICLSDSDCDDGLACTLDRCGPDGVCISTPSPGTCLVGGACFADGASPVGNLCLVCKSSLSSTALQPVQCNDGKACTDDSCAPATGCGSSTDDTNPCSDGDPCTKDDACVAGVCTGSCECRKDSDCGGAVDVCRKWACVAFECVAVPDTAKDGATCEDGSYCTTGDSCLAGACKSGGARNCSAAGNGKCTVGTCSEDTDSCVPETLPAGTACSDGDSCTVDDVCSGTVCKGKALDCSALTDACRTGQCVGGSCKAVTNSNPSCDDGIACTAGDTCGPTGVCSGTWDADGPGCGCGSDADCAAQYANDPCNVGKCNVQTHACFAEPKVGAACDDGNPCSSSDKCTSAGQCKGAAYGCDDDRACTTDSCDGLGGCTNTLVSGSCLVAGVCYKSGQTNPANFCQICQSGNSWSTNSGAACTDSDPCTKGDTCAPPSIPGGTPFCKGSAYSCSALPNCQAAACDGAGGCTVTTLSGWCVIGNACVAKDAQNPANACEICDPSKSTVAWSPRVGGCNDGNLCTRDDLCTAGTCKGTAYSCTDGLACTTEACDGLGGCSTPTVVAGNCVIDGACHVNGAAKPGNSCLACKSATSTSTWSAVAAGGNCTDGLACTSGDACDGAGVCTGSLASCAALECETPVCNSTGGCDVQLKAGYCKIAGACYAHGAKNPANECLQCVAQGTGANTAGWTALNATSCNDGALCTHTDTCVAGQCKGTAYSCDDSRSCTTDICDGGGSCSNKVNAGTCLIGGVCVQQGAKNPDNECQSCNPTKPSVWTSLADGSPCLGDTLSCTLDQCSAGQCTHPLDAAAGACLIAGACHLDGAKNPQSDCQVCKVTSATSAWTNLAAGTACGDDGNSCTTDLCNSTGSCAHASLTDFAACDDGNSGTTGDWCHSSKCAGFVRVVYSGDTVAANQDRFVRAVTHASGVHVAHLTGASGSGSVSLRNVTGTSVPTTSLVALGSAGATPEPALADWLASKSGGTLWEFVGASSTWTNAQDTSSIRKAWAAVTTNAGTTWRGVASGSASLGGVLLGSSTVGAGSLSDSLVIRRCSRPLFCFPTPCSLSWGCSDVAVTSGVGDMPVNVASVDGTAYVASNWPSVNGNWVDIHGPDANGGYSRVDELQVGANALLAFESLGTQAIGAGSGNILFSYSVSSGLVPIDLSSVFSGAPSTTWTAVDTFGSTVMVAGHYSTSGGGLGLTYKNFVIAYAPTTAALTNAASWKVHTVFSFGGLFIVGACSSSSNVQVNAVAAQASRMQLFGSWCTSGSTSASNQQDAAMWTWTAP